MNDNTINEIVSTVQEVIESSLEEKIEELTDKIREIVEDSIEDNMRDSIEDTLDEVLEGNISDFFTEGLDQYLSDHQFVLPDGTLIKAKQKTRVMPPNKQAVLVCYGGIKIKRVGLTDRFELLLQTSPSRWEEIWEYINEDMAKEAFDKIKQLKHMLKDCS